MTPSYQNTAQNILDVSDGTAVSFVLLIAEVRKALLSNDYEPADQGQCIQKSNPSFDYSIPTLTAYFEAFLGKLNSFLYLFNEPDLRTSFQYCVLTSGCSADPDPESIDTPGLYLVLALGAKHSNPDSITAYKDLHARTSNFLSYGNWGDNLWAMRMLALLCICHCDERHEIEDQSRHYLSELTLFPR